jgi:hypothetical protein
MIQLQSIESVEQFKYSLTCRSVFSIATTCALAKQIRGTHLNSPNEYLSQPLRVGFHVVLKADAHCLAIAFLHVSKNVVDYIFKSFHKPVSRHLKLGMCYLLCMCRCYMNLCLHFETYCSLRSNQGQTLVIITRSSWMWNIGEIIRSCSFSHFSNIAQIQSRRYLSSLTSSLVQSLSINADTKYIRFLRHVMYEKYNNCFYIPATLFL